MNELSDKFDQWRNKKISSGELNDLIREYNQGPLEKLWGTYDNLDPKMLVGRGVAEGLLTEDEISTDLGPRPAGVSAAPAASLVKTASDRNGPGRIMADSFIPGSAFLVCL